MAQVSYNAKVNTPSGVNIRKGPGKDRDKVGAIENGKTVKIVEEVDGWGKLDSGKGWICLKYTVKV